MSNAKSHVRMALRAALLPLVRLAMRSGLQFRELSQLLKEVTVDAARSELQDTGSSAANSRVAILSGVDRKEVARSRVGIMGTSFGVPHALQAATAWDAVFEAPGQEEAQLKSLTRSEPR